MSKPGEKLGESLDGKGFQFEPETNGRDETGDGTVPARISRLRTLKFQDFKLHSRKQMDELKQQMEQFQQNFKLDPKQIDELPQANGRDEAPDGRDAGAQFRPVRLSA